MTPRSSLCADHELPVSTFAARCVASARATPYAAVQAGLAALGGVEHGDRWSSPRLFCARSRRWETRGRSWPGGAGTGPGFGHRLYPEGDPRGAGRPPGSTREAPPSCWLKPSPKPCSTLRGSGPPWTSRWQPYRGPWACRPAGPRGPLRGRQDGRLDRARHRAIRRRRPGAPEGPLRRVSGRLSGHDATRASRRPRGRSG
jgi:hypothetical protein